MVFMCQQDSYLKEFSSRVVSCTPVSSDTKLNGENPAGDLFQVVLEDTILFPEGGGQPCDTGRLDDVEVVQVIRRGAEAVHLTRAPVDVGKNVRQTIDWDRRFDHMQHHSGQHLITGLINEKYGFETTAWWLGEEICYIELDTNTMDQEQLDWVERTTNEKIRDAITFTVDVYDKDDPLLKQVRGRGLPEDTVGGIRVVTIQGIESDMCCGTHVCHAAQLQVAKMLGVEKGKKGKINLQFIFGGRVVKMLAAMMKREQQLTSLLNNGPECHVDLVSKSQKAAKVTNKNLQSVLKELAIQEARCLKSLPNKPKFYSSHRKEAGADYMNVFLKEFSDKSVLLLLTVGEEKGAGQLVLHGEESLVQQLGDKISEILDGKGAGKGSKYQAKVKNLGNRKQAEQLIRQTIDQVSEQ